MHHVRALLLGQEFSAFRYLMSPYFTIENLVKDPDIQKRRKLTGVSFLHEPFSSEFHVFVTFQSSHLDADIWKILQAVLLYRKCILALQLYS